MGVPDLQGKGRSGGLNLTVSTCTWLLTIHQRAAPISGFASDEIRLLSFDE